MVMAASISDSTSSPLHPCTDHRLSCICDRGMCTKKASSLPRVPTLQFPVQLAYTLLRVSLADLLGGTTHPREPGIAGRAPHRMRYGVDTQPLIPELNTPKP